MLGLYYIIIMVNECVYIIVYVFILKMNDRSRIVFIYDNIIVGSDFVFVLFFDFWNLLRDDVLFLCLIFGMILMKLYFCCGDVI